MTTLIIKQNKKGIPTEFETWEDLQAFILNKLVVKIYPVEDSFIDNELKERTETIRREFRKTPQSFDNI